MSGSLIRLARSLRGAGVDAETPHKLPREVRPGGVFPSIDSMVMPKGPGPRGIALVQLAGAVVNIGVAQREDNAVAKLGAGQRQGADLGNNLRDSAKNALPEIGSPGFIVQRLRCRLQP